MYFSIIPKNMKVSGNFAIINYFDGDVVRELYIPYDKNYMGGYTNIGFYQPSRIPILVSEREFNVVVEILEE